MFKLSLSGDIIIFLDIDGPLLPARMHYEKFNSTVLLNDLEANWQDSHEIKLQIRFDPVLMNLLNCWLEQTDAKLVISSNWSKYANKEQLTQYLVGNGFLFPEKIHEHWCTSKHKQWTRGDEIAHWLSNHREEIQNYLILDDDFTVCNNERLDVKKVLLIDFFDGLKWSQVFEGYEILGIAKYD